MGVLVFGGKKGKKKEEILFLEGRKGKE